MKYLIIGIILMAAVVVGTAPAQVTVPFPFKIASSGDGKPIVFLPDAACAGEVWDSLPRVLAQKGYQCNVLTLAGNAGQSIAPYPPYLSYVRDQLIRFLKLNKMQDVTMVGHGLGGVVALMVASTEPTLFGRIVIVDAFPFQSAVGKPAITKDDAQNMGELLKARMITQPDSVYKSDRLAYIRASLTDTVKYRDLLFKWAVQSDRYTLTQGLFEMTITDLRQDVAKITCPVLVIGSAAAGKQYGLDKTKIAAAFKEQYKPISNCKIVMAAKARHFVMLDEPAWFLKQVKGFLGVK